nr:Helix-turn-helix domain protein [Virgibacillus halodenitrificans]
MVLFRSGSGQMSPPEGIAYTACVLMLTRLPAMIDKPLYSTSEAAELLGASRWTISRWVRQGFLHSPIRGRITAGSLRRLAGLDAEGRAAGSPSEPARPNAESKKRYAYTKTVPAARPRPQASIDAEREFDELLGLSPAKPKR